MLHLGFSTVFYPKCVCVRKGEGGRNIRVKENLSLLRNNSGSGDIWVVPCFEECVRKALQILNKSDRHSPSLPHFHVLTFPVGHRDGFTIETLLPVPVLCCKNVRVPEISLWPHFYGPRG